MSTEDNKSIARQFIERGLNERDLDFVRQIMRADFVDHGPPSAGSGIDGFMALAAMATAAFPDLHVSVEDTIAEGDRVAVRVTVRGTHEGVFLGNISPTGRKAVWTGIDILRIEDGQIAERWSERDIMALMRQLEGKN